MKVEQEGTFEVARTQEEVFRFLSDPTAFSPLLPGFEGIEEREDGWVVRLRVGVSHLKGTAKVRLKLDEIDSPHRARYVGSGSLLGGVVNLIAEFQLKPRAERTEVHWEGEAQVAGRLAAMARGLLEPLARKNIQSLIDAIVRALTGQEPV